MQTDRDTFNVTCYYPFNDVTVFTKQDSIILNFIHDNIKIHE